MVYSLDHIRKKMLLIFFIMYLFFFTRIVVQEFIARPLGTLII